MMIAPLAPLVKTATVPPPILQQRAKCRQAVYATDMPVRADPLHHAADELVTGVRSNRSETHVPAFSTEEHATWLRRNGSRIAQSLMTKQAGEDR